MIVSHIVTADETTRRRDNETLERFFQRSASMLLASVSRTLPVPLYADLVDVATQIVDIVTVIKLLSIYTILSLCELRDLCCSGS